VVVVVVVGAVVVVVVDVVDVEVVVVEPTVGCGLQAVIADPTSKQMKWSALEVISLVPGANVAATTAHCAEVSVPRHARWTVGWLAGVKDEVRTIRIGPKLPLESVGAVPRGWHSLWRSTASSAHSNIRATSCALKLLPLTSLGMVPSAVPVL
jgi:hypothetical protein